MRGHIVLFCLGLITISCVMEKQEIIPLISDSPAFYATIEVPGEPDTRAFADDQLHVLWDAGDHVSIFNKYTYNREYAFQGETGENSGTFEKVPNEDFVVGNDLDLIYAVYPYRASTRITDDGEITITLPSVQPYRENSFGREANTMVSVTEDNELYFRNLCGYFAVRLYGDNVSVSSISLEGNNGEYLAGKATIVAQLATTPVFQFDPDYSSRELVLTSSFPVEIGTTAETATTFWFVIPPARYENGITLTVRDGKGGVFVRHTTGSLVIRRNMLKKAAPLEVDKILPEAIDLGLSVKWAPYNLGASKPEEYGDYYAWGEVELKADYSLKTYKWCNGTSNSLTKYNADSSYGTVDNKTTLDLEDDAANVIWGGNWRMPTNAEWMELKNNCNWTWTKQNGINGRLVTASNGNSIFLPAAGYRHGPSLGGVGSDGRYWSSSLNSDNPTLAWRLGFYSGGVAYDDDGRYNGFSIRPVYVEPIHVESVSLDRTTAELSIGESLTLSATVLPENAIVKQVIWSSSDETVATVSPEGCVDGVGIGSAIITVTTCDGWKTANCYVTVKKESSIEAVDLGLPSGLKWASCNLGAAKPEEYGNHYAWGETVPKNNYTWATYKFELGTDWRGPFSKYVLDSSYGTVDNKPILEQEDDAACVNWGNNWRMPTDADWTELKTNCTWTWTTRNGVKGRLVTGPNDNSIFLPAASASGGNGASSAGSGGYYWSSSLSTNRSDYALYVFFSSSEISRSGYFRNVGQSIRPVCP